MLGNIFLHVFDHVLVVIVFVLYHVRAHLVIEIAPHVEQRDLVYLPEIDYLPDTRYLTLQ